MQTIDTTASIKLLNKIHAAKLGGKATGVISRRLAVEAKERYNSNPNHCITCNIPILASDNPKIKLQQTQRKKHCSHSCAAKHRKGLTAPRLCHHCNKTPVLKDRIVCDVCKILHTKPAWFGILANLSKESVFSRCKNWQSARTVIRQHAAYIYALSNQPKICKVCGYSTHVEVCHIQAVSSFLHSTLISEINNGTNLVALCRNHHWELDHGILKLVPGVGVEPTTSSL